MTVLKYDGTFEGLLTAIFEVYEYKFTQVSLKATDEPDLFSESHVVVTDTQKSERVFTKIHNLLGKQGVQEILYGYLSELPELPNVILTTVQYAIENPSQKVLSDYSHPAILTLQQTFKKVAREKHRMEAFVRFQLLSDGIYYAEISPDFNVLPLIQQHFKDRYSSQKWIIADTFRNYGLFYDLYTVQVIYPEGSGLFTTDVSNILSDTEVQYQTLWKSYFKSTTIQSRINLKLHKQHVPKRYWKYLTEKQ